MKFSKFMSRGGAFDSLFCPEGRVFVHNDCPEGDGFCSLQVVSGRGMVLDEVDTCIIELQNFCHLVFVSLYSFWCISFCNLLIDDLVDCSFYLAYCCLSLRFSLISF